MPQEKKNTIKTKTFFLNITRLTSKYTLVHLYLGGIN